MILLNQSLFQKRLFLERSSWTSHWRQLISKEEFFAEPDTVNKMAYGVLRFSEQPSC